MARVGWLPLGTPHAAGLTWCQLVWAGAGSGTARGRGAGWPLWGEGPGAVRIWGCVPSPPGAWRAKGWGCSEGPNAPRGQPREQALTSARLQLAGQHLPDLAHPGGLDFRSGCLCPRADQG